jgi:hypothetical protein
MDHFASQRVMLGQNDHLSWIGNITSFAWKLKHIAKKKKPKQNKTKHYMILTPFLGCWKLCLLVCCWCVAGVTLCTLFFLGHLCMD